MTHYSTDQLKEYIDTTKTRRRKFAQFIRPLPVQPALRGIPALYWPAIAPASRAVEPERTFELLVQTASH